MLVKVNLSGGAPPTPPSGRPEKKGGYDIASAGQYYSVATRTVFIADSNILIINTDDFTKILQMLCKSFPNIERITSYARAKTILKKPLNEFDAFKRQRAFTPPCGA